MFRDAREYELPPEPTGWGSGCRADSGGRTRITGFSSWLLRCPAQEQERLHQGRHAEWVSLHEKDKPPTYLKW